MHADGTEERDYDGEDVHAADVGGYLFDLMMLFAESFASVPEST